MPARRGVVEIERGVVMDGFSAEFLVSHVGDSIQKACRNESKLSKEILDMKGMTGKQTRHLYNNLCSVKGMNYLEVGVHRGSSYISALHCNPATAVAIDNWSEFGDVKAEFFGNFRSHCFGKTLNIIERDCFEVTCTDISAFIPRIDVYLYDGKHTYDSQKLAMSLYRELYSRFLVIVVDDWRYDFIQSGTRDGLVAAHLDVLDFQERITHESGSGPIEFWNGFGIFVCEKKGV